jgi:DNA-binding transcriptional ArsR family regulator
MVVETGEVAPLPRSLQAGFEPAGRLRKPVGRAGSARDRQAIDRVHGIRSVVDAKDRRGARACRAGTLRPRPKRRRMAHAAFSARLSPMTSDPNLAWIAAVVGDPARLRILLALMDGRARTAKELAFLAGIAAPTASGHLAKLLDSRLVAVDPQGRHRYYRIASPLVAEMVEAMSVVAGAASRTDRRLRRVDPALVAARTCYDHLAGRLAVAIADALQKRGDLVFADGGGEVTGRGQAFFKGLGIDAEGSGSSRRMFCKPCLDWTERRHHLAGALGAALCRHCLTQGWLQRTRDSRALTITRDGAAAFADLFGIDVAAFGGSRDRAAA